MIRTQAGFSNFANNYRVTPDARPKLPQLKEPIITANSPPQPLLDAESEIKQQEEQTINKFSNSETIKQERDLERG